jgi:hypothetical protein
LEGLCIEGRITLKQNFEILDGGHGLNSHGSE